MAIMSQLSFAEIELGKSRKPSRVSQKLDKINGIVDWALVLQLVKVIDKTSKKNRRSTTSQFTYQGKDVIFTTFIQFE